jgi:hypothetical protein
MITHCFIGVATALPEQLGTQQYKHCEQAMRIKSEKRVDKVLSLPETSYTSRECVTASCRRHGARSSGSSKLWNCRTVLRESCQRKHSSRWGEGLTAEDMKNVFGSDLNSWLKSSFWSGRNQIISGIRNS